MVIILTIKSETNIQGSEPLSVANLLKLCANQDSLLQVEDKEIGRLITQLSDYEQELYEKDIYIEKLENELRQTLKTSYYEGKVL
jgi:hypothetical protein